MIASLLHLSVMNDDCCQLTLILGGLPLNFFSYESYDLKASEIGLVIRSVRNWLPLTLKVDIH